MVTETRCNAGDFAESIRQHFAGRISPSAEHRMREHLEQCAGCRDDYNRQLVLAEIDPRAKPASERIAVGLGLHVAHQRWSPPVLGAVAAGMAAAAGLVVLAPWSGRAPTQASEFQPRGAALQAAPAELIVYRVAPGRPAERVQGRIRPDDELAFSYTNRNGWAYLLVFGVDEHGHVFWYYPAWSRPEDNPRAIPVKTHAEPRELTDAVQHRLDGSRLHLYGVFTNSVLSVRDVEGRLKDGLTIADGFKWERELQVEIGN